MLTDVEAIDLEAGTVAVRDLASGRRYRELRPPGPGHRGRPGRDLLLPGCDATGVFGVQTLDDGAALLAGLERLRPRRPW